MTAARCSVGVEDKICIAVPGHVPHTDNYDYDLCLLPSFTKKRRNPGTESLFSSLKGRACRSQFLDMWKEWLSIFGGLGPGDSKFRQGRR